MLIEHLYSHCQLVRGLFFEHNYDFMSDNDEYVGGLKRAFEARSAKMEQERADCRNRILSTRKWLNGEILHEITNVAIEFGEPEDEVYIEFIRTTVPFLEGFGIKNDEELSVWFIKRAGNEADFRNFTLIHFSAEKLDSFRSRKLEAAKRRWRSRLGTSSLYFLKELSGAHGIEFVPEKDALLRLIQLSQHEFEQYEKTELIPQLKHAISSAEEKLAPKEDTRNQDMIISVQNKMIIQLRDKNKELRNRTRSSNRPTKAMLRDVVDQTRKKNNKINYSGVARHFRIYHTTAKRWIDDAGIK